MFLDIQLKLEKDHLKTSIASLVYNVNYIERHFTLDRSFKGTDHAASLEPGSLKKLTRDLLVAYKSLKENFGNKILEAERLQRSKLKITLRLKIKK